MYKKPIAAVVALSMAFNYVPVSSAIAEDSTIGTVIPIDTGSLPVTSVPMNVDLTGTSGTEHAYDPFAELEAQKAEQELRESTDIVEKTVIFSVKDSRSEDEPASYLNNSSKLCTDYSLGSVEMIYESEIDSGTYEVFYQAAVNTSDIWTLVDKLNADSRISSAEPDFIWESTETVSSYNVSADEYNHSTHFPGLGVVDIWNSLFGNNVTAPGAGTVVAVIDTGVDYTHVDLKDNMWKNTGEIPGNGIDDDNNGYIDDVYGYDFVENDGNPMDDMGHGTHVAGIIAMSKNNVGGVGLAYGSKIMAIKAGQATGSFASTDIAKAIRYASDNGADVINMSFGGTGKSALVEAALRDASHDCVLVAAAGNDGLPTTDAIEYMFKEDFYPAGYDYVLGVMATDKDGNFAGFSNWDYTIGANCEYELAAPGVSIYSTLPGNRYAYWSGTSMAAPNVAAASAILRSRYTDKNKYTSRFIMGQLVSATDDTTTRYDGITFREYPLLNIEDSLTQTPTPSVILKDFYIFDDPSISPNNNGDGIAQPGEIIDIGISAFNYWGVADDVTVKIDTLSAGDIPNPHVELINDNINIGSIGIFATGNNGYTYTDGALTGVSKPLRIKIKEGTANDIQIPINFTVTCKNGMDETDNTVYNAYGDYKPSQTIIVQNGVALSGVIDHDMTLKPDKYWIIQNNVLIPEGVTVTVEPGTQIQFWSADPNNPYADTQDVYIQVEGRFIAEGTEDKPIQMFPGKKFEYKNVSICGSEDSSQFTISHKMLDDDYDNEFVSIKYSNIINLGPVSCFRINDGGEVYPIKNAPFAATKIDHCNIVSTQKFYEYSDFISFTVLAKELSNSIIVNYNSENNYEINQIPAIVSNEVNGCLFDHCFRIQFGCSANCWGFNKVFTNCVLLEGNKGSLYEYQYEVNNDDLVMTNNAFIPNVNYSNSIIGTKAGHNTFDISNNYWGTNNSLLVKKQCYDADKNVSYNQLVQEPFLTLEDDMSAIYPFVTEAYLTDKDGNRIDTVNGKQQVSLHVKFNRDMAQDIQPQVTYGGSAPYTDYAPSGTWIGAREWRADFTIDPDYDLGRMYIRIKGAAAADDKWLVTGEDTERFFFEITNTGAQAMKLQGEGLVGQNALTWVQDDYDTLAGYNVYRSTSYDPSKTLKEQNFTKLNTSLLSESELSYLDEAVEPCVDYYYYFTVMDTDMKESKGSNVIMCTPTENVPPEITHTPITSCNMGDTLTFNAVVTDNVEVTGAVLHYKVTSENEWRTLNMKNTTGSNYRVTLNAYAPSNIEYYITATDSSNNTGFCGTQSEPKTISCRYLTGIEITSLPDKVLYVVGDDFEAAGLEVAAIYSDNTRETLADNAYSLMFNGDSDFDSSEADTITVTVEYNLKQAEFDVDVTESSGIWDTDNIEWHWESFKDDGTVTAIVKRTDDPTQTQTMNATVTRSSQSIDPTCTASGNNTYIATIELDNDTFSNSFSEIIGATGHHYYVSNAVWNDDNSSCTLTLKCFDCDDTVADLQAEINSKITKEATYSETGQMTYTAIAVYGQGAFSSTKTVEIPKIERTSISGATVVISDNFFTYDGTEKTVSVSSVKLNGELLTENTDYEVIDNSATAPGKYTLKIKGIGAYKGTVSKKWEIVRNCTVTYTVNGVTKTDVYTENAYGNIKAPSIQGKDFSHWVLLNDSQTMVSTNQSYNFRVTSDLVFEAVYVENGEPVEKLPVIAITDVRAVNNRIYYEITRDIPSDYTVISNGILYGTSATLFGNADEASRDENIRFADDAGSLIPKEKVHTGTSTVNTNKGYFSYYLNIGSYVDTPVYLRGYVIVKDSNDNITTYYTSIFDRTYNQLINA